MIQTCVPIILIFDFKFRNLCASDNLWALVSDFWNATDANKNISGDCECKWWTVLLLFFFLFGGIHIYISWTYKDIYISVRLGYIYEHTARKNYSLDLTTTDIISPQLIATLTHSNITTSSPRKVTKRTRTLIYILYFTPSINCLFSHQSSFR